MPAVTNGAELVKRLAASGTGGRKLDAARRCLAGVMEGEGRVASAAEVLAALEGAGAGEGTLEKARAIASTGEWAGPAAGKGTTPIEEQLLAEKTAAKK